MYVGFCNPQSAETAPLLDFVHRLGHRATAAPYETESKHALLHTTWAERQSSVSMSWHPEHSTPDAAGPTPIFQAVIYILYEGHSNSTVATATQQYHCPHPSRYASRASSTTHLSPSVSGYSVVRLSPSHYIPESHHSAVV
ncbi:hypothetical protein CABS01_05967 [Colletotrichum abscissum]|uniref:uncharacterized protein n=1 Tax=Colletotrichum abscissum TaxID=1671311 RepID=UPI0027D5A41D|nr:uncharacterized protein CABS01_05967 [Colletotrichum abscissum]KAK1518433.1 hypothetical protein CABS01_05967 [Colletotrichum abscissum]